MPRNALHLSWNQALIPKCLFKHSKDKCSLIFFFPIHLSFSFLLSYHEFLRFQDTLCHLLCTHKYIITITEKHASCQHNNHFKLIVCKWVLKDLNKYFPFFGSDPSCIFSKRCFNLFHFLHHDPSKLLCMSVQNY